MCRPGQELWIHSLSNWTLVVNHWNWGACEQKNYNNKKKLTSKLTAAMVVEGILVISLGKRRFIVDNSESCYNKIKYWTRYQIILQSIKEKELSALSCRNLLLFLCFWWSTRQFVFIRVLNTQEKNCKWQYLNVFLMIHAKRKELDRYFAGQRRVHYFHTNCQ